MDRCPCKECICLPRCITKEFREIIRKCPLVWKYLIDQDRSRSHTTVVKLEEFESFCSVYGLETHKKGGNIVISKKEIKTSAFP